MSKNIYVKETYEWIRVGNGENIEAERLGYMNNINFYLNKASSDL
ncbi:hypothetical protein QOS_1639, partial [Clostridioides difficile Y184]